MEIIKLIKILTGEGFYSDDFDRIISDNGDPVRRISRMMARRHIGEGLTENGMRKLEDDLYKILLPLHPILCFLREQRREIVQRVFEQMEARTDRSTPPAGPEITHFFASKNEEDDAIFPEEVEEARKRRIRKHFRAMARRRQI